MPTWSRLHLNLIFALEINVTPLGQRMRISASLLLDSFKEIRVECKTWLTYEWADDKARIKKQMQFEGAPREMASAEVSLRISDFQKFLSAFGRIVQWSCSLSWRYLWCFHPLVTWNLPRRVTWQWYCPAPVALLDVSSDALGMCRFSSFKTLNNFNLVKLRC